MHSAKEQFVMLKKLAELEKAVSRLYRLYAERFLDFRQFWVTLANYKLKHADDLIKIDWKIHYADTKCQEDRFNIWGIERSLEFVKNHIKSMEDAKITHKKALSTALEIEKSILQYRFYDSYDTDSAEIKGVLEQLKHDTEEHIKILQKLWFEK
jgi:hypothetical protein